MGEIQEKQRKKRGANILIVILLIITIVATSVGLYAWARYVSVKAGDATAQVAKWHFELVDGNSETEDGINFPITRTDGNDTVEKDKLAPGTFGEFQVIMDSTGTEVSYRYDIKIEVENCPTNLNFYKDSSHSSDKKIEVTRNKVTGIEGAKNEEIGSEQTIQEGEQNPKIATFTISKYVSVERANNQFSETIYWDWPYETQGEGGSTDENDRIDTEDQGKDVKMKITVIGTEVMSNDDGLENGTEYESTKLSELVKKDKIKIGDYVNYDATRREDGRSEGGNNTFTISNKHIDSKANNESKYTFTAKGGEQIKWRVLNIDKGKGTIDIMAETEINDDSNKKLYLKGENGFINSKETLNNICAIYGHGYGAESARSIRIGDIVQYTNYDPKEDTCSYSDTGFCGGKNKEPYTGNYFFKEIIDEATGEVIGYEEPVETKKSAIGIIHQTCCKYIYESHIIEKDAKESLNEMIFERSSYWIASRNVRLLSTYCCFSVYYLRSYDRVPYIRDCAMITSSGTVEGDGHSVLPVVTLKSDIQMEKKEGSQEWDLIKP